MESKNKMQKNKINSRPSDKNTSPESRLAVIWSLKELANKIHFKGHER